MVPLLRSCVEVCTAIELSFGMVSGVGPGIHVLDGVHMPRKEGAVLEIFQHFCPIGLNGQNNGFFTQNCI